MSPSSLERRRLQRIRFTEPLLGITPHGAVSIVDLSISGLRAEHPFPLGAGRTIRIDLEWNGEPVSVHCDVLRCRLERRSVTNGFTYASGLRFTGSSNGSISPREMMVQLVTQAMLDQRPRPEPGPAPFPLTP